MLNLHKDAQAIAVDALAESDGCFETARDYIHQSCDSYDVSIYYHKAIQFCADQDTSDGEQWLEDCGGIARDGDCFGQIACRIAFATLLCAAESALYEMESES